MKPVSSPLRAGFALPIVLLAACATLPPRSQPLAVSLECDDSAPTPACTAALAARIARVSAPAWQMQGGAALRHGEQSGSVRIDWQQHSRVPPVYQITLSVPVTRQSWRLQVDGDGALVEGLPGGARHGADAEALLAGTSGLAIPLRHMPDWLRGLPSGEGGTSRQRWAESGQLLELQQDGWQVRFEYPAKGDLPQRIVAKRSAGVETEVRLFVERWRDGHE